MNATTTIKTEGRYFIVECECCPRRRSYMTLEAAQNDAHRAATSIPVWALSGM